MTTYTPIATSQVDVDSPVTQTLMTALRDNPLAIQEGDPSAPNVLTGVANRTIFGGVGTYVFAVYTLGNVGPGGFVSGAHLVPTSAVRAAYVNSSSNNVRQVAAALGAPLPGTWMCMGFQTFHAADNTQGDTLDLFFATLFVRKL